MGAQAMRDRVGNLPAELTTFVGRRREIDELKTRLASTRLLTLTGMGGVGKTRLARQIAADVNRAFPDGVWQVELADLGEPALVVQSIADCFGLLEEREQSPMAALKRHLAGRRLLLVLDNCEHLVDACAAAADVLLRSCPGLRMLATSREPLGVSGERIYPVLPLSVPEAAAPVRRDRLGRFESVTLFVDRAGQVLPGFEIDDANQYAVAKLCSRLEGLPLAIELAALWMRTLSPDQILAQLDQSYRLLGKGNRTAPPRQRTLSALVDWSYMLCSEEERSLWRCLSVFSGTFQLDAATGVYAGTELDGSPVVDLIAALVEKSVLVREDQSGVIRFRMPEVIRDYALDLLGATPEAASARRRHCDWYLQLAHRARLGYASAEQLSWFGRLRAEQANFRVALEFSLGEPDGSVQAIDMITALIDYWTASAFAREGRHWLQRALGQCPAPTLPRARALRAAGFLAAMHGDIESAAPMIAESRQIAQQGGYDEELGWLTYAEAWVTLASGDLARAARLLEEARDRFSITGDDHGLLDALADLAINAALSDDPRRTLARVDDFMVLAKPKGESYATAWVLWALGLASWRMGELERAAELETESLKLRLPFGDRLGIGLCAEVLAWISADQGRAETAARLLGAARQFASRIGSSVGTHRFMVVDHERCVTNVRTRLREGAFESAFRKGSELHPDEIIALASGSSVPAERFIADHGAKHELLTRRELQIADLVARGMSNKEIAAALVISQRTAEGHIEHILTKLGFTSRTQIAAWAADKRATEEPVGDQRPPVGYPR